MNREIDFDFGFDFVRAVRAGEAKLCGRVRDASSDAGAACLENILVLAGSCASSNTAVRVGFISFWSLYWGSRACLNALRVGFMAFSLF